MFFKRSFSLFTIIASFLLIPNVFAGYQLGGEMKGKVKEKRVDLTIKDFKYPILFDNNIYDFVLGFNIATLTTKAIFLQADSKEIDDVS